MLWWPLWHLLLPALQFVPPGQRRLPFLSFLGLQGLLPVRTFMPLGTGPQLCPHLLDLLGSHAAP